MTFLGRNVRAATAATVAAGDDRWVGRAGGGGLDVRFGFAAAAAAAAAASFAA